MSQDNTLISYIGQKISKVSWCVEPSGGKSLQQFYTASCGELTNQICRWSLPEGDSTDSDEPIDICSLQTPGSVTDFRQIDSSMFVYSCENGKVCIGLYDSTHQKMQEVKVWNKLHTFNSGPNIPAPCTCLATVGNEIISGGEDGRIHVLIVDQQNPVISLDSADSSNITGLDYLSNSEIISINASGQLKLWDIRTNVQKTPKKVMTLSGNPCSLLSVNKHPNQQHILVTGNSDGAIGIWDIRQEKSPVSIIDAHESEVWQVLFHTLHPDNLFTCSQDGSCWFWDGSKMIASATSSIRPMQIENGLFNSRENINNSSNSVWLYIDANKHKLETFSLLPFNKAPVNCFDIHAHQLICATENDALIIVPDIPVHS